MGTNLCIMLDMGLLPTTRDEGQELLRDRPHVRKKDSRQAVQELRSRGGCGRTVETGAGYCTILKKAPSESKMSSPVTFPDYV